MTKEDRNTLILRFGEVLTDREIETKNGDYIRIRVVRQAGNLFYSEMQNGEVVEVKLLQKKLEFDEVNKAADVVCDKCEDKGNKAVCYKCNVTKTLCRITN